MTFGRHVRTSCHPRDNIIASLFPTHIDDLTSSCRCWRHPSFIRRSIASTWTPAILSLRSEGPIFCVALNLGARRMIPAINCTGSKRYIQKRGQGPSSGRRKRGEKRGIACVMLRNVFINLYQIRHERVVTSNNQRMTSIYVHIILE